jgi:erythromycin esterase-like protein
LLAEWLRGHNERHVRDKVGFYGLDVYSLWESFDEVLKYLENKDLTIKKAALDAFNCFEPYKRGKDRSTPCLRRERSLSCEDEVVNLLTKIRGIFQRVIAIQKIVCQTKCTGNC